MIISRTPFRVSFFGGGTDYPAWYRQHGGSVLATAIDKYCYISCRHLPPFFEHRIKLVYSKIENCHGVDEIKHPSIRECVRYLGVDRGLEIHHDADLPARCGMGSSSSFTARLASSRARRSPQTMARVLGWAGRTGCASTSPPAARWWWRPWNGCNPPLPICNRSGPSDLLP